MSESRGATGVLLLAYGGPRDEPEIEPFLAKVTGRTLPPQTVAEFRSRYAHLGGRSPLPALSEDLARVLAARLAGEGDYRVTVGHLFASPSIGYAVAELAAAGVAHAVAIVLVPQFSAATVGRYIDALNEALAAANHPFPVQIVKRWASQSSLIDAFAEKVEQALDRLEPEERERTAVVFSGHSVPAKSVSREDPFEAELATTADAVARRAHVADWRLAYQSGGRGGGEWFGPTVAETLAVAAAEGKRNLLVVPIHFLADNLETLYDLDVELRGQAEQYGIRLLRTESLNTSPLLVEALAALVLNPPAD